MNSQERALWPLSSAQLGHWLGHELDPSKPIDSHGSYLEIFGHLEVPSFEKALRRAIAETEALYVRFVTGDHEPMQCLKHAAPWTLSMIDVSDAPDPRSAAEAWMRKDLARPIDLGRDSMFAHAVFRLAPHRYFWYQRYHLAAVDGFGAWLITRRVSALYGALVGDGSHSEVAWRPGRAFPSLRYMVDDDRAYRASEQCARDRRYWCERLADRPHPILLGGRSAPAQSNPLQNTYVVPAAIVEALRSLAAAVNTRWSRILIAAMALHVQQRTGQHDVILSLPVTGRVSPVSRIVPGMMRHLQPLRLTVHSTMRVADLLRHVAEETSRALQHQRYPDEALRRDLQWPAEWPKLYGPIVDVLAFSAEPRIGGHVATRHWVSTGPIEEVKLTVHERPHDGGLQLYFEANPNVYDPTALANHGESLRAILERFAAGGLEQRIGEVDGRIGDERAWRAATRNDVERHVA